MDKSFMSKFYRKYYKNFQAEIIGNSEKYKEKRNQRYEVEQCLESKIKESSEESFKLFNEYLDVCSEEMDILLELVFLAGAEAREKMLRGII